MVVCPKDFKDGYIDGKFIKLNVDPIVDYVSFTINDMLYFSDNGYLYSYITSLFKNNLCKHTNSDLFKLFEYLSHLEAKVYPVKAYRKLSNYGIIYKNQSDININKFTYIHKGQHLYKLGNDFFPTLCFFLFKKKHSIGVEDRPIETLFNFKRLDFAFDLYGIDLVDLLSKETNIIFSKKRLKPFFYSTSNKGSSTIYPETFYLGKVNSLFSLCIYKRHLKLKVSGPITRIEFRFKNKYAQNLFIRIMNDLLKSSANYSRSDINLSQFKMLYNLLLCKLLYEYLDSYLSVKIAESSKSFRLDRHKTCPWFEHLLFNLKAY